MSFKDRRLAAKLTQRELAEAVNVDQSAVSKWECGRTHPAVKYLPPIAKALGITVKELFEEFD